MTEKEERLARDRAEIAARVASFRETQQKFEREREEYYETTLANALNGSGRPSFWRLRGTGRLSPTEYGARNPRRGFHQENSAKAAGTKPALRRFLLKCSNLARGESMKDPVCISGCGRGFRLSRGIAAARDREPCDRAGLIIEFRRN